MKLQFLGTGGGEGWPGIFCRCDACLEAEKKRGKNIRMHPGAIIDDRILMDFSPDLYAYRLRFGVDLAAIKHVIITHPDGDHFELNHLESYPYGPSRIQKGQGATFYGNSMVKEKFDAYMKTPAGKRAKEYVGFCVINAGETKMIDGMSITALLANHGCEGYGNLYLIRKDQHCLLYAHDTGLLPESSWEILKKERITCISMDASYGPHPSPVKGHMSFLDNIATRERMLAEGIITEDTRFILSHFLHEAVMMHEDMVHLMEPQGFTIAYDGMCCDC